MASVHTRIGKRTRPACRQRRAAVPESMTRAWHTAVKQNAATSESSNGRHIRPENSFRGCNSFSFDRGSADLCCFVSVVVHFVDARSVIVVTLCTTRANVAESRCAIDERLRLVRQNARIVTVYD